MTAKTATTTCTNPQALFWKLFSPTNNSLQDGSALVTSSSTTCSSSSFTTPSSNNSLGTAKSDGRSETSSSSSCCHSCSKEEDDHEEILQVLREDLFDSADKQIVSDALEKLSGFCTTGLRSKSQAKKNAECIVYNDGVGVILSVLKSNPQDVGILTIGAAALANLMNASTKSTNRTSSKTAVAACHEKVHRLGGAKAIVMAMRAHPNDEYLQCFACGFIEKFVYRNRERQRHFASELHGIPTLAQAMLQHPNNKSLHKHAITALSSFCRKFHNKNKNNNIDDTEEYNVNLLVHHGGGHLLATAIATALDKHGDIPKIKTCAVLVNDALLKCKNNSHSQDR